MLRLLRWITFLVLIAVVVGIVLSYPILRDRFVAPMLAAPANGVDTLQSAVMTLQPTATITPTTQPSVMPTIQSTLAPPRATSPALIIQAPSPTVTSQASNTQTPTAQSSSTATPFAIATTSLLVPSNVASATSTPVANSTATQGGTTESLTTTPAITVTVPKVVNTAAQTATTVITKSVGIAVPVTPSPPPPTVVRGQSASVGEKGYEPPLVGAAVATEAIPTPILVMATPALTSLTTPIVVTTVELSPVGSNANITPMVVLTISLTPQVSTIITAPLPLGPIANANGPLYSGPDFNASIVGQVTQGEQLLIIGIYTEGTWYLLANGMWLPGATVANVPLALPLVFPTITPIPTNTPTITPTPSPTATLVGSATPSPTPTSLEAPVCDCSIDNLDCLGNIFANRAAAQSCFEYCFRQTGLDIHLLDPNLNGVACENLR